MPAWLLTLGTPLAKTAVVNWLMQKGKALAVSLYYDLIKDLGEKDESELTEELESLRKTIIAYPSKEDVPKALLDQYWVLNEKLTTFR